MGKFSDIAREAASFNAVMQDREKMKMEEVVGETLTLIAFDFAPNIDPKTKEIVVDADGEVVMHAVLNFKEYPENYFNGGSQLTKICRAWMAGYDSAEEASKDLAAEGGVIIKPNYVKTLQGNNFLKVDILN